MIYHKAIPLLGGIISSEPVDRRLGHQEREIGGFEEISAEQRAAIDTYRTCDELASRGGLEKITSAQSAILLFKYGNWLIKHGRRAPDNKKGEDMIHSTMRLCLGK